jgi:hypothetical protein
LGKFAKLGQMAVMQFWRNPPACTQRIAVHIIATNATVDVISFFHRPTRSEVHSPRITIAGYDPYMPKEARTITG